MEQLYTGQTGIDDLVVIGRAVGKLIEKFEGRRLILRLVGQGIEAVYREGLRGWRSGQLRTLVKVSHAPGHIILPEGQFP